MNTPPFFNHLFVIRTPPGESTAPDCEKLHFDRLYPQQTRQVHTVDNAKQCSEQIAKILAKEEKIGILTIINRAPRHNEPIEDEMLKLAQYLGDLIKKSVGPEKAIKELRLASSEPMPTLNGLCTSNLDALQPLTGGVTLTCLIENHVDIQAESVIYRPRDRRAADATNAFDEFTDRFFLQNFHS